MIKDYYGQTWTIDFKTCLMLFRKSWRIMNVWDDGSLNKILGFVKEVEVPIEQDEVNFVNVMLLSSRDFGL